MIIDKTIKIKHLGLMNVNQIKHNKLKLLCTELEKHNFELWADKKLIGFEKCGSKKYNPFIINHLISFVMATNGKEDVIFIEVTNDGRAYTDCGICFETINDVIKYISWTLTRGF